MTANDYLPEYCSKSVLVLGCGNILLGDDGFGPAVSDYLLKCGTVPDNVCVLNAGTSSREFLFNIVLSVERPETIIVVDAMECGGEPGDVVELSLDSIPENKTDDFSIHQVPSSNLVRELRDLCNVEVVLIVMQPCHIPSHVNPGLSPTAQNAVPNAADHVFSIIRRSHGQDMPD